MEESKVSSTLRFYAKYRIFDEMIKNVRKNANTEEDYYFLVADQNSLKIFSSVCKVFDLVPLGIAGVELLEKKRKKFPNSDIIYFLTPCASSVRALLDDFQTPPKDSKDKTPQYGYVHLCFNNRIDETLLQEIAGHTNLAPRIRSFFEINLDFLMHEHDFFHFGMPRSLSFYKAFSNNPIEVDKFLSIIAKKLFSVCNVFNEFPYIHYSLTHPIAKKLAFKVNDELKDFYAKNPDVTYKAHQRATLIVLDRSFDISTPLSHDMSYESLTFDLLDMNQDEGSIMVEGKKAFINENDELWMRTRALHIAEAMNIVNSEFKTFAEQNQQTSMGKEGLQNLELSQVSAIIKNMPKYQELMKKYSVHLNLTSQCVKGFQTKQLKNVIDLEQTIISGVETFGRDADNKNIVTTMTRLPSENPNLTDDDIFRILALYITNYDVPEKNRETLFKFIKDESKRQAMKNIIYMGINTDKNPSKAVRKIPKLTPDEVDDYLKRRDASQFDVPRRVQPIVRIVTDAYTRTLPLEEFPFVEKPLDYEAGRKAAKTAAISKRSTKVKGGAYSDSASEGLTSRIIVFVLGGLSHQEIVALSKLKDSQGVSAQIVAGSNYIAKTENMIQMLQDMHRDKILQDSDLKSADVEISHIKLDMK